MNPNLTDSYIKRLSRQAVEQGKRKDAPDPRCPGLLVRCNADDTVVWAFHNRDGTLTLGPYSLMGLAEARAEVAASPFTTAPL